MALRRCEILQKIVRLHDRLAAQMSSAHGENDRTAGRENGDQKHQAGKQSGQRGKTSEGDIGETNGEDQCEDGDDNRTDCKGVQHTPVSTKIIGLVAVIRSCDE